MNLLLLAVLVFGVGARLTRLLNRDTLFEPLRDRWSAHFQARQDRVLREVDAVLPPRQRQGGPPPTYIEWRAELMEEVDRRAREEHALPMTKARGPWQAHADTLMRLRGYSEFLDCPWCAGFWVFLATWVGAWLLLADASYLIYGGPWWLVLPGLALAYGWVYALIANRLDGR